MDKSLDFVLNVDTEMARKELSNIEAKITSVEDRVGALEKKLSNFANFLEQNVATTN